MAKKIVVIIVVLLLCGCDITLRSVTQTVHPPPPSYDSFTPNAPRVYSGSIVVTKWDVGGGNLIRPKAKINARVRGGIISRLTMYYADENNHMFVMQTCSVVNGSFVRLNARYPRAVACQIWLVLYDEYGRVAAFYVRSV